MKVLVVEDSKPVQMVICHIIRGMNHVVITAESGEEALKQVRDQEVDLILMDVEMPGINGFETTRRVRELGGDQWIPIIFLSANSEESYLAQGIDAGGDDYLVKPVKPVVLQAKIRAMERIAQMRNDLKLANADLAHANEELERLSCLDGLTSVVNRRGFDKRFDSEWKRAKRENKPFSLLMIDIDNFKTYNDTHGHLAGDDCLRVVAKKLQDSLLRPGDLLARYGGEEFVVLLPDTNTKGAYDVASRMRQAVYAAKIEHKATNVEGNRVSVSVGINCSEIMNYQHSVEFLNYADYALYQAKSMGRNRCITFDPAEHLYKNTS